MEESVQQRKISPWTCKLFLVGVSGLPIVCHVCVHKLSNSALHASNMVQKLTGKSACMLIGIEVCFCIVSLNLYCQ